MNILFWNLGGKDLRDLVCKAAKASSAEVVILIESKSTHEHNLDALKLSVSSCFYRPVSVSGRFQLFCRDAGLDLSEFYDGDRVSLRLLRYDDTELTLGLVHLIDKSMYDEYSQLMEAAELAKDIRRKEDEAGHARTILIGDFNMNPFDSGMTRYAGMNAMMTRKCIERGARVVQNREYNFFYNPMWGLLGDRHPDPPGTFYHASSSDGHYGWNMLDQVLFRPAAVSWLDGVQILKAVGPAVLHTKTGRPSKTLASDHFPILLTLRRGR